MESNLTESVDRFNGEERLGIAIWIILIVSAIGVITVVAGS
jgi:hypothetical protein